MQKRGIICATLALSIPAQASAESWLCIPDLATGFKYDAGTKQWREATFKTEGDRYIIKAADDGKNAYVITEFGDPSTIPNAWCENDINDGGYLFCKGIFTEFKFNKNNLRFLQTYHGGYIEIQPSNKFMKEGDDTPLISIGRCSKI